MWRQTSVSRSDCRLLSRALVLPDSNTGVNSVDKLSGGVQTCTLTDRTLPPLAINNQQEKGIGKPEPLRHSFQGYWSRRIMGEHRMVYRLSGGDLWIAQLRYHY